MTFKQLRQLFFDYWWILAGAILLIVILVWIFSGGDESKQEEQLETNIDVHKGEANVLSNVRENIKVEVNNAANNSNQAQGNFDTSVNRDSSQFNGNSTDKFCERFPRDSTCREWCIEHPHKCR